MSAKAKKEAKKLEKLRAEAEFRKALKRAELERELAAQALKRDELDKSWREMMLKLKEPVFKMDIQVMWQTFERAYDKKDHLIAHTMRLMNVADNQFQRTFASFCDTVDNMIVKFLQDMEVLSQENDRKTVEMLQRAEEASMLNKTEHTAAETHLQLLIYHADRTADALAWTTRGENLVKEDEEKSRYFNVREDLRSFLEYSYNAMWTEYKAVLKSYIMGTADNQKQMRKLKRKENLMADVIASQAKKIANSDSMLKRLRSELCAYESGAKQAGFRDRRDRHRNACMRLKRQLFSSVDKDNQQLETLVKNSNDAIEWLEVGNKRGEQILRMAALCRKFETRREKVLPYGSSIPQSSTQAKLSVRKQLSDDSLVVNALSTTSGLTRLWQRIAQAELTKRALLKEKLLLEHENALIMMQLQNSREEMMISDAFNVQKATVEKPVAIEAGLEITKIKFLNNQN